MKKSRKLRLRRIARRSAERRQLREENLFTGIIHMTAAGYGFVSPADTSEKDGDIFVPAKFAGFALDGDTVKVKILPPRPGYPEDSEKGPVGKVVEIVERSRTGFVGQLLAGSMVSPLNTRLPEYISIHGSRHGAVRGDWVQIECETARNGELTGKISRVIGKCGDISGDLDAIMTEYDLPGKYSADDEVEAEKIIPADIHREDMRELFVLTIDPFDAKDFDDALSVAENGDGTFTVGIHIADVAAYIHPKDRFDKAAKRRGFSCYLPGRTLPMLPAGLTAKISMQQGQDSLAHSVFLRIDQDGRVLSGKRCHTRIKVVQRLDYDEVQEFLDSGSVGKKWVPGTVEALKLLTKVVRSMRDFRAESEEFIELPLPEVRVICDEKSNTVTGIEKRLSRESEQLVEECMLAANSFVGKELPEKSVAGIYRVHPEPEAEKSMEFCDIMQEAFHLSCGDISNRKNCRNFVASLPDDGFKPLILSMLLRSMPRAYYAVKGDIHYALGKTFYAHFTSPIRRYTDLTVHQQLWNFDRNQRTRNASALEQVAEYCSEVEENVDAACNSANDRLKIRIIEEIMENDPGRKFDCMISRVLNSGIQVEVPEFAVYAYVSAGELRESLSTLRIGMTLQLRGDKLNFLNKRK